MSVLTVTNTVPDPAFSLPQIPGQFHSEVSHRAPRPSDLNPPAPVSRTINSTSAGLPTTYTRPAAQNSQPAAAYTHRHSRTISSSTLPTNPVFAPTIQQRQPSPQQQHQYQNHHRRQSSTTSARSLGTSDPNQPASSRPIPLQSPQPVAAMQRQSTTGSVSNSSLPRRSTSGRSTGTNSSTSYVTLMRKQKATVWCDRSQSIDARVAAQQKMAKQRALHEVAGNNSQRTSTLSSGGVVGKIRHGGVPKAQQYTSPNLSGVNVPKRLLAYDMQDDDESQEGRIMGDNSMVHARTGSGKSSINSGKYRSGYPRTHTSPPETGSPAQEGIPEASETPAAQPNKENYFEQNKKSCSDSEDSFGELRDMTGPNSKLHAMEQRAREEDLRRRGSVDERTTTMRSTQRLFVANPDLDDD